MRSKALSQLREHMLQGRVDPDVVDLLDRINSSSDYYTTSSCSGRIQLAACEHPGEKGRLRVLAKWHRPIKVEELVLALSASQEPSIWFSVHPPILHIVARDLEAARRLLVNARNSGFKHSGIQGLGRRVVVEVMSMERLETPLRLLGVDLLEPWAYPMLVDAANRLLVRSKKRLEKLKELF
ncbi:MAG: tRNA-wybutosine modification methyltransferase TYW3 [Thermofilaceae archaeon]